MQTHRQTRSCHLLICRGSIFTSQLVPLVESVQGVEGSGVCILCTHLEKRPPLALAHCCHCHCCCRCRRCLLRIAAAAGPAAMTATETGRGLTCPTTAFDVLAGTAASTVVLLLLPHVVVALKLTFLLTLPPAAVRPLVLCVPSSSLGCSSSLWLTNITYTRALTVHTIVGHVRGRRSWPPSASVEHGAYMRLGVAAATERAELS